MGALSHFGACIPAFDDQEQTFAAALAVLGDAILARAFPGAAAAVVLDGKLVLWKTVGNYTYEADAPCVSAECVWDLASVSKVIATTAAAMVLYERGWFDLELPVARVVPEFAAEGSDPRRERVTLRMLLSHSSGLPAYYRMYETARTREDMLSACFSTPLEADPGTRAEYSDIGFMLLGVVLERLAREDLDAFCQRELFDRLQLGNTTFNPPSSWRGLIPPTENDTRFRHRVIRAEVNDENAWVLGGVAGHAGVFSTALDVARFGHCMMSGGNPLLNARTVETFTTREFSPAGTSRTLGWDTPSQPSQSGRYFSPRSFGHLGFTGTSLWCDSERQLCVVLLTNRTWPDRLSQRIKQVRPQFHDAIIECLGLP